MRLEEGIPHSPTTSLRVRIQTQAEGLPSLCLNSSGPACGVGWDHLVPAPCFSSGKGKPPPFPKSEMQGKAARSNVFSFTWRIWETADQHTLLGMLGHCCLGSLGGREGSRWFVICLTVRGSPVGWRPLVVNGPNSGIGGISQKAHSATQTMKNCLADSQLIPEQDQRKSVTGKSYFSTSSSLVLPVRNPGRPRMLESLSYSDFYPAGEIEGDILRERSSILPSWLPRHQEIRERLYKA